MATKTVITKRGYFVIGLLVGSIVTSAITFYATHHSVVDKKTCQMTDEGMACSFHYERNK